MLRPRSEASSHPFGTHRLRKQDHVLYYMLKCTQITLLNVELMQFIFSTIMEPFNLLSLRLIHILDGYSFFQVSKHLLIIKIPRTTEVLYEVVCPHASYRHFFFTKVASFLETHHIGYIKKITDSKTTFKTDEMGDTCICK